MNTIIKILIFHSKNMIEENKTPELPEELDCPEVWPFGPEWNEKIPDLLGWKAVDVACGVIGAGYEIRNYLTYNGQSVFEKLVIQNKIIRDIKSGKKDPAKLSRSDVDWQMGNTWEKHIDLTEKIFLAYGANRAPADVLEAINYEKDLIEKGENHSSKIIEYIEHRHELAKNLERKEFIARNAENEKRNKERSERMQAERSRWNQIDIDHSKVEHGFIYVLKNDLMPGVFKIGFTANNPDKRALQISQQYNLPMPFSVHNYWRTFDPYIVEQRIHSRLNEFRVNGEFFKVDIEFIETTIRENIQSS